MDERLGPLMAKNDVTKDVAKFYRMFLSWRNQKRSLLGEAIV